jgi:hypothetical protein
MTPEQQDTDITWHRQLGRRLAPGEVEEDRARGAYMNGRLAWVLVASLIAVIVVFGALFALHGQGLV